MLNQVRKLLRDRSPNWLNTEVNKNLLQNLSNSNYQRDLEDINISHEQVKPSLKKSLLRKVKRSQKKSDTKNCQLLTVNSSPFPTPGTPHWRRIKQVFVALDSAPADYTYDRLIEYVRQTTGKGCSRKLISKWKKCRQSEDCNGSDKPTLKDTALHNGIGKTNAVSVTPAMAIGKASPVSYTHSTESTVNHLQLTETADNFSNDDSLNRLNLLPVKTWSYLAAAGIALSLVGCEILPFNDRPTENIAVASVTAPITPLPPRPNRRNRLEPRNIKIELTLSNPQDLKVKPGDKISTGQALSDRKSERNRLQAKKKQLQLSLSKLNLPLAPIPQPRSIPEIRSLPPISYAESEAAIKLKQQKLTVAKRAIAIEQQQKIDSLSQLSVNSPAKSVKQPAMGGGNVKLILEHERANLANLESAKQSAQIQLEVAQSKLTTAKENRAYIEYQRQLEQTRRAIAIEQQHQAVQRQESERSRLLSEREFSQAQIEAKIQDLDYQIIQLSSVLAPYHGTIKKVKWTGQSNHNITVELTLAVDNSRSTVANSQDKPIPGTQAKQTAQTQP